MTTLTILVPVFFLLVLGYVSRVKGWLTLEQKNGANSLVFTIFFPILIFHHCDGELSAFDLVHHRVCLGHVFSCHASWQVAGAIHRQG